MKFNWAFFKTTKGILTISALFFFFVLVGIMALVSLLMQAGTVSEAEAPPVPVHDLVSLFGDEKKTMHLGRAEIAMMDALTQGAARHNYKVAHEKMTEAVDETVEAVGEDSLITCMFIDIQSDIESSFKKWPVVEELQKRLLSKTRENEQFGVIRARARIQLGQALDRQHKTAEALKVYKENVSLAEERDLSKNSQQRNASRRALKALSACLERHDKYDEACLIQEKLATIVLKQPDHAADLASIYCSEGRLRWYQRQYKDAFRLFEQSIALDPSEPYVFGCRGMLYLGRANYPAAIDDLNKAIKLDPKVYWYYTTRADAQRKSGNLKAALADADEAIKLSPEDIDAYLLRARLLMEAGRNEDALVDCNSALRFNPRSRQGLILRANLYQKIGESDLAIRDDTIVLQLGYLSGAPFHLDQDYMVDSLGVETPATILALQNRSIAYKAIKQDLKAEEDQSRAKKLIAEWSGRKKKIVD